MTRYTPYAEGEAGFQIGLRPLDPHEWIEPDERAAEQFANKARLLSERPGDVVATTPGSEAAQGELLTLLSQYLARQYPELYRRDGSIVHVGPAAWDVDLGDGALAAIDRAGRLVQEDLCLMQMQGGRHVLTAASLCAPSVWRLSEKIGRPLGGVHEPVPGFAAMMEARVERIFSHLKVDAPVWRLNWSVMSEPTLFLPETVHDRTEQRLAGLVAQTAGDKLFLRVERQTLRRLPVTGAIVFTIKTYIDPLRAISERPDLMRGLRQAITAMPEEMAGYKAMAPIRDAVIGWLDWCLRVY
ncbi:MAG: DUF3445 domain-containing protein [Alphaproteobacteria bacterium]|nr:DUF3445 domain-containing protein [Alphaproteobacteria bacterium]